MTLAVAVALLLISCTGTASETSASSQSPPASGTTVSSLEAVDGTTDRFAGFPPLDEADIAATREALEHQIFAAALSAVDMLLPAGRSSCEGALSILEAAGQPDDYFSASLAIADPVLRDAHEALRRSLMEALSSCSLGEELSASSLERLKSLRDLVDERTQRVLGR